MRKILAVALASRVTVEGINQPARTAATGTS